jgi:hypothetical protein
MTEPFPGLDPLVQMQQLQKQLDELPSKTKELDTDPSTILDRLWVVRGEARFCTLVIADDEDDALDELCDSWISDADWDTTARKPRLRGGCLIADPIDLGDGDEIDGAGGLTLLDLRRLLLEQQLKHLRAEAERNNGQINLPLKP